MIITARRARQRGVGSGIACAAFTVCAIAGVWQPAAAETLNEALSKAYSTNPDLAAARSRLRQVDEHLSVANANWRPSLEITTDAARLSETVKDSSGTANDSYNTWSAEIQAVQPLFSSGRFGAIRGVARAQIRAERAQLRQVEQHVLLDTVKAFADVANSEASFDLIREDVTVLHDVLKQTSERAQHHRATETDVELATAALEASRAECLSRQAKLLESWRTYQQLVGEPPALVTPASASGVNACIDAKGERRRSTIALPDTFPAVPRSVEEVEQAALDCAPEVEFARAKEEEAHHAADAAYDDLMPSARLTAKFSTDDGATNGPNTRTQDASINAEIRVPVFNGGVEWSAIRSSRERSGEARLLVDGSERQITRNAATAWFELQSVQAVKLINKMQARTQQDAFEGLKKEIANPKLNRSTSDLLLQQHAVLSSRLTLAQSDRDEAVAIYTLLAATGRLTPADLKLGVDVYDVDANLKTQSGRWVGGSIFGE